MKIVFNNAKEFRAMLNPLYNIVDETVLKFEDGLLSRALDGAKMVGVKLYIPEKEFEEISFDPDEKVGINLAMLFKMTKKIGNEKITLETEGSRLKVLLSTEGKKRRFILPILDIPETLPKDIVTNWTGSVRMDGKVLKNLLEDLSPAGDAVLLRIKDSVFEIVAKGDTEASVEFTEGMEVYEINGTGESMFSMEFLKKAAKPLNGPVLLNIGMDENGRYLPLKMEYDLNKAGITTWVGPRSREEY